MSQPTPLETCQPRMNSNVTQILRWIDTGEYTFDANYIESHRVSSVSVPSEETPADNASSSTEGSFKEPNSEFLIGCKDDPLIPCPDQIHKTFLKCQNIWRSYLAGANSLPSGCMPTW